MDKGNFPESRWTMGRFIGIAWDTGDLFTFKVWSEPDGNWKKGREFVRNVVRARDESDILVDQEEKPDLTRFKFQRMKRTNKRKRNGKHVYELQDIPEGEVEDTMEGDNVEVEDVSTMQAETRSVTFTNDSADTIREPMVSQNQGEEAGAR